MIALDIAQLAKVVGGTATSAKLADLAMRQLQDETSKLVGSVKGDQKKP